MFSVELPVSQHVKTRSATQNENNIASLWLLLCNTDGTFVHQIPATIKSGNGTSSISFVSCIPFRTEPYNLMLVANVDPSGLQDGMTRTQIQETLRQSNTAQWTIDGSQNRTHNIPMVGELTNQTISAGYTPPTPLAGGFHLKRMLARVNVQLSSAAAAKFRIEEVCYYNYNTVGNLVPDLFGQSDPLDPSEPSVPAVAGNKKTGQCLSYTASASESSAMLNRIYVFENKHVAPYPNQGWVENPCIVVRGLYDENNDGTIDSADGASCFYRLDFVRVDNAWLDVVRNNSYNFTITQISGKGYPTADEALRSAPINISANVVDWDNSQEITGGKWEGEHYIYYTAVKTHFNQFGQPTPQTLRVITNVPDLAFGKFKDIEYGVNDVPWRKKSTGEWTNNHFTVGHSSAQSGGEYIHTLTISADEATADDKMTKARQTVMKASTSILSLDFEITQDEYVEYKLVTSPDPIGAIVTDHVAQRIRLGVESTHEYEVVTKGDMFEGIYTTATGGTAVSGNVFPKTTRELWVALGEHMGVQYGQIIVRHTKAESLASISTYNVLQVTPWIAALFKGGKYVTETQWNGGSYEIDVSSNMIHWEPSLSIYNKDSGELIEEVAPADLGKYFDLTEGSQRKKVTITIPPLPGDKNYDREYRIRFHCQAGVSAGKPLYPGIYADLKVVQLACKLELSPSSLPYLTPTWGGETKWISVKTNSDLWSIDNVEFSSEEAPDGRRLVQHNIEIEILEFDSQGRPYGQVFTHVPGTQYQPWFRFRIRFPKVYYPNRDIAPTATVTIGAGHKQVSITATQKTLTAKPLKLFHSTTQTYWGAFFPNLADRNYISDELRSYFLAEGFSIENGGEADTWEDTVPDNTTLLYSVYNEDNSWAQTNSYRARSIEHWSMIQGQGINGRTAMNNAEKGSPMVAAGYSEFTYVADDSYYANNANNSKLMQYLLRRSPENYLEGTTEAAWRDGINLYIPVSKIPSTGVPLMVSASGECTALIDIKNRIFWMGETEHWGRSSATDRFKGGIKEFGMNITDFMAKAVAYGSHFTDLLLEDGTDFSDGRKTQPAPWDSYWDDTANGGTDNRLKPVGPPAP
jgi:hypothetical protein